MPAIESMIGDSPAMQEVYKAIGRVAPEKVNVLILGESGTGKELVAQAIQHHSPRSSGAFLAVNCAAVAASFVRRIAPAAKGSGLPHVEAVLKYQTQPAPPRFILVKFVGGGLAIGGGFAHGREGPGIQMGAGVGDIIARISRLKDVDAMALIAAGGGAGLAVVFNAPMAGTLLVLVEMMKRFETRKTIAVLAASSSAISVSRLLLGSQPDFNVAPLSFSGSEALPLFIVLELVLGFLGVIFGSLGVMGFPGYSPPAMDFAAVGMAAFFCATVRAPVVGIILAMGMTASFTLILPMVAACFGAMLVATLMNDEPIYEAFGKAPDEREILPESKRCRSHSWNWQSTGGRCVVSACRALARPRYEMCSRYLRHDIREGG